MADEDQTHEPMNAPEPKPVEPPRRAAARQAASEASAPAMSGGVIRDRHAYPGVAGKYVYTGSEPTEHRVLGHLEPGETLDYTGLQHPEMLQAVKDGVEAGLFKKA